MGYSLLIDIGSTYTKVTAVDISDESLIGTARAFTTVATDVNEGLQNAMAELQSRVGKIQYSTRLACSSAAGGLKMIAVGLVPDLTAEAAKRAALSAGAKVLKTFAYELSAAEVVEIHNLKPDIILLSGGTDGGNKNVILHNAEVLAGIEGDFPIVAAGNKSVISQVEAILKASGKEVRICPNVMPEFNVLNIEPAREMIREIFLQRIIQAKGLTKVQELVEGILMPTPSAVLNAARVLATGCNEENGLGDLMVVDVGGATTDVYSICDGKPTKPGVIMKGLPEPFAKRTVEGDLGVRYSAAPLVEAAGLEQVAGFSGLSSEKVMELLDRIQLNPNLLARDDHEVGQLDLGLASMAVRLAVERHAGRIECSYTPFGQVYMQTGKDLAATHRMIGTGGPVINSVNPKEVLKAALQDGKEPGILKPENAELYIDRSYIMAAMGLLAERHPEAAIRIMKKEIEMCGG